ncbi:MAG: ATP-binding cassette domain-containing protein [Paracoccaceae bacterium]
MLALEGVRIRLGGFALAADLTVAAGARVAVIGPSGAGKSTLIGAIAGFVPPQAGRVLWEGRDLGAMRPGERPLSILFQEQNLFPHLTVAENLGLGIAPSLRLSEADRSRVGAALGRVEMDGMGGRRAGSLSGGEGARVALARVLLRARPLLLLDEPFAALGPGMRRAMLGLVAEVAGETGAALLMVSHDPQDARRLCPATVVVAEGRARPPVPTGSLLDDPPREVAEYLGK